MKQYIVFGPVWGQARGEQYSQIVDLEPIGTVRATSDAHAMRNAKSRGFHAPIIQQKERKDAEPISQADTGRNRTGATRGRTDASANGHIVARKS